MIKKSFKGNLKNSTKKDLLSTINDLDDIIDVNRFFKNKNINKDLAEKLLGESKFSDDLEKPLSNASKAASETAKDLEKVGEASKSVSNVASDLEKVGSVAEASADGVTVLKAATEGLESGEASAEGLGTAFKGLGISILSALPAITAIGAGIVGLVAAYKYVTKFDDAVEKAETSQSNFEQTKSELSSLQDELDSTKDKIKELKSSDKLTIADQAQLSTLKTQSKELQRQIDLKKKLADSQSQKAVKDAMSALKVGSFIDHTQTEDIEVSGGHGEISTTKKDTRYKRTDIVTAAKNEVKELNKLKEEREKLLDDYDKAKTDKKKDSINSDIEAKEKEISKYEDTVEKKIQKIQKLRDNFLDENDNLKSGLTSKQQAMYNNLTKVLDDYTNNDPVAKKAAALEKIWDNKDFAKAQQSLVDKIRQGQDISVDSLKKDFPELVSACDKAGISVSDLKNELDALGQSSSGVTKLENDFEEFQTTAVGAINSVDALNAALANNVSGKGLGEIVDSTETTTGKIILNVAKNSNLGGDNVLNGTIPLTFTISEKTIVKNFTWTKAKAGNPGQNGQSARLFSLDTSTYVIKKNTDGTLTPSTIVFSSYYKDGESDTRNDYLGRFLISESTDGLKYSTKYTSTKDEQTVTYTPSSSSVSSIKCILCASGGITNELDSQTVVVLTDADGVNEKIKEITETVSGVSSRVDAVNKSITDKVWQSDITNSINNYDNTTTELIRSRVSQVEQDVDGIKSTVSDVQTTLTEKADGSTVTELSEKVSTLEQNADGFKQTVEKNYVAKTDLNISSRNLLRNSKTLIFDSYGVINIKAVFSLDSDNVLLNKNNDGMVNENGVLYFDKIILTLDENGVLQ